MSPLPLPLPLPLPVGREASPGVVAPPYVRHHPERTLSEKRLSLTANGNVRYQLKTPYRDGTTHVIFEPLDFIARLAALVPKPRVNLTRFHGVFAPNSHYRAKVTSARRGRGGPGLRGVAEAEEPTAVERRASMNWAQRLKRVFSIDPNAARSRPARPAVGRCGS